MKRACSYYIDTSLEPELLLAWWQLLAVVTIYESGKVIILKGCEASE